MIECQFQTFVRQVWKNSVGIIEYEQKQPPQSEAKDKRPSQNPIRISSEKDVEEHSSDNETIMRRQLVF